MSGFPPKLWECTCSHCRVWQAFWSVAMVVGERWVSEGNEKADEVANDYEEPLASMFREMPKLDPDLAEIYRKRNGLDS